VICPFTRAPYLGRWSPACGTPSATVDDENERGAEVYRRGSSGVTGSSGVQTILYSLVRSTEEGGVQD